MNQFNMLYAISKLMNLLECSMLLSHIYMYEVMCRRSLFNVRWIFLQHSFHRLQFIRMLSDRTIKYVTTILFTNIENEHRGE